MFQMVERGVKSGQCMYKVIVFRRQKKGSSQVSACTNNVSDGRKRGQVRSVHVQPLGFRGQKEGSSQVRSHQLPESGEIS